MREECVNADPTVRPTRVRVPAQPHTAPRPQTAAPNLSELFSYSVDG